MQTRIWGEGSANCDVTFGLEYKGLAGLASGEALQSNTILTLALKIGCFAFDLNAESRNKVK